MATGHVLSRAPKWVQSQLHLLIFIWEYYIVKLYYGEGGWEVLQMKEGFLHYRAKEACRDVGKR